MDSLAIRRRGPLLFMHIPKTAGTSMRRFLAEQYARSDILPATNWREVVGGGYDPTAYALCSGHFPYSFRGAVAGEAKTLTLLRDPVERYLSQLRHARADPVFDSKQPALQSMSVAAIIRDARYAGTWANAQTRWLGACADPSAITALLRAQPDADPNSLEARCDMGDVQARARAHLDQIDFVGFVEDIATVVDELATSMSFHPALPLAVANAAKPGWAADPVTAQDRALIGELNAHDIALYAYALEASRRRRRRHRTRALVERGIYHCPPLPFEIDVARPIPGHGWWPAEAEGGATWRWTAGDYVPSLQLATTFPPGARCVVSFHDWSLLGDPMIDVRVNGEARAATLLRRDGSYDLTFEINPQGSCAIDYCDIALALRPTPRAPLAPGETRSLGLPVFRILFSAESA